MLEEDGSGYCMKKIVSYLVDKLTQVNIFSICFLGYPFQNAGWGMWPTVDASQVLHRVPIQLSGST